MKKNIISAILYLFYVIALIIYMDNLPYWVWKLLEAGDINTYNLTTFVATTLIIVLLIAISIWSGYVILRQLIKSSYESKRFCGVFLLCCIISFSLFNIWHADIPGIYYKTSEVVKIYTEPNKNSTPLTISRDVLGSETINADFRYANFLEFEPGSYLHKALSLETETKLYLPEAYARSYSYTIG